MRGLRFFFLVLFLTSLACQTFVGGGTPQPALGDAKPTRVPSPTAPPPITRLSGVDLPIIEFAPPAEEERDRDRPSLSSDSFTLDSEHFRIHYTLEGDDAIPPRDANANEIPDYLEEVARALEFSWYAQVEYFGWSAPPSDENAGGDERYDIYLINILGNFAAGLTASDWSDELVGDNPNSSLIEENSTRSFIVLDNDYKEYEEFEVPGISRLEYMRTVAAHEFNHAIQFGYDGQEPHDWLWEATATWMEDEVFDSINETLRILPAVFKSPDTCQIAEGGSTRVEDGAHWYGMWVLMRYLSEQYGNEGVRRIWELVASEDGYDVWDAMLLEKGSSFDTFFTDFSLALLTRDFQEGDSYPVVRLEGRVSAEKQFTPADGVEEVSMDYVQLLGEEIYTVHLESTDLLGLVVGVNDKESYVFPLIGNQATVDFGDFEHIYLIVLNLNRALTAGNCHPSEYTITLESGGTAQQAARVLPSFHFELPRVEPFHEPVDYFDE